MQSASKAKAFNELKRARKTPMRLGILMSVASPWAREIALGLTAAGQDICVIDFAEAAAAAYLRNDDGFQSSHIESFTQSVKGVHLLEGRASPSGYIRAVPALRKILRLIDAEALLVLYAGGFAAMAYLSGFRPYVVYVVGSDVLLLRASWRPITRLVLRSAESVFSVGEYLSKKTRELAPDSEVEFLLPGINIKKYVPGQPRPSPVRILCSRGFLSLYNNAYLVEALASLPDGVPGFEVTFAGPGPMLDEVRLMAGRLLPEKMRSKVYFLGGVNEADMLKELQSSHIYVSLSNSDGTSNSLLEALACGLFPILSDIPQNREWVGEDNGILVPFGQPGVLAGAIVRAITDQSWRQNVAPYNRELVALRADSSKNVTILASRLESIVEGYQSRERWR